MGRPPSRARPTIIEVAKLAGVSFKTVARVVNDEPGVSPQRRDAVLGAMRMLSYVPNVSARQLRSHRSFLIGFLCRSSAEYAAAAQTGALKRCREIGYNLIVEEVSQGLQVDVARRLQALRVDGVVLVAPLARDPLLMSALKECGLRYVLIQPETSDGQAASVSIDDRLGALEMTRHLIGLGHRDIGFIGASEWPASCRRHAGFVAGLAEAGVPRRLEFEADEDDFSFKSGEQGATRLLHGGVRPTAIFATTDSMALGAMTAAARRGIQVPSQLSIAGFDDTPSASVVWPPLTTVRQPIREMSAAAIDLLLDGDPSMPGATRLFEFELIIRGSTAPPGPAD